MRKLFGGYGLFVLALLVLVPLVLFSIAYTVRFTESAVVTTFGRATESDVSNEPGLKFKAPYPIQSVTKYDTRVRLLNLKMETQQTADNRTVVVELFCTWRVSDPLKFFQRFSNAGDRAENHYAAAERALTGNLRAAAAAVSRYRMDELFSPTGAGSKLPELEKVMLDAFATSADQTGLKLDDYGIAAVDVGLTRVVLTEDTTKAVFERMKAAREKIARTTQEAGRSQATAIRSAAQSDADRIRAFAELLAQEIRGRGDQEAVQYLARMNANSDLASFLVTMDFIRNSLGGKRTTLVLSSETPGINMLMPDMINRMASGQIPAVMPAAKTEPEAGQPAANTSAGTAGGAR